MSLFFVALVNCRTENYLPFDYIHDREDVFADMDKFTADCEGRLNMYLTRDLPDSEHEAQKLTSPVQISAAK